MLRGKDIPKPRPGSAFPEAYPLKSGSDSVPCCQEEERGKEGEEGELDPSLPPNLSRSIFAPSSSQIHPRPTPLLHLSYVVTHVPSELEQSLSLSSPLPLLFGGLLTVRTVVSEEKEGEVAPLVLVDEIHSEDSGVEVKGLWERAKKKKGG